jgi:hypothetical protein
MFIQVVLQAMEPLKNEQQKAKLQFSKNPILFYLLF